MSDSLWSHGLQHIRLPCPSPTLRAYSNSCPWSWWCYATISLSVAPVFCLQSFPAPGSFQMSQFFASGGQSIGVFSFNISPSNEYSGKSQEEGGLAYAKAGSSLRSSPGNSWASTPKPESAYFLLCAFTYTSDFTGGCPPLPLWKKS